MSSQSKIKKNIDIVKTTCVTVIEIKYHRLLRTEQKEIQRTQETVCKISKRKKKDNHKDEQKISD